MVPGKLILDLPYNQDIYSSNPAYSRVGQSGPRRTRIFTAQSRQDDGRRRFRLQQRVSGVNARIFERHRVRDYARWREVFDADTENREAAGCRGARIFRNADDPEEVVVLFEWDSLERARRRIESTRLKEEFDEAGVSGGIGQTEFYLLEEESRPSA